MCTQLYEPLCWSVGPSVGPSVAVHEARPGSILILPFSPFFLSFFCSLFLYFYISLKISLSFFLSLILSFILSLLIPLSFLGSGPAWKQSPVDWGETPSVFQLVRPSPPNPPIGPKNLCAGPQALFWQALRPPLPGPQAPLAGPQAPLAGPQALTPLWQALRPLQQALTPLWQALRPIW